MRTALAVASECVPLVKTGGLADVVGALPGALVSQDWQLRTLLPGYPVVMKANTDYCVLLRERDLFGGPARLLGTTIGGQELLILDAPHLYDRPGTPYWDAGGRDWPDNDARFAALSWMAARIGAEGLEGWKPELLHLHDWQAALAAVYLRQMGAADQVGTLLTIHNIAFHGLTSAARLLALRLPEWGFTPEGFEYYGHISALKAGLVWADRLSTVSPSYAHELTKPEFGMGLDGVIRARAADLTGILNGIDTDVWNPATDPHIRPYSSPGGKAPNRRLLQREFGLPDTDGPICIVVSRMSPQKGLDLLLEAVPVLHEYGGQIALLGSGDRALENAWLAAAEASPSVAVRISYDETLAHRMFAGADAVIVPSRFEPCGLTQLYGLRYGTIPVVSLTGGLADTLINANEAALRAGTATGLQFTHDSQEGLRQALRRLCDLFRDRPVWAQLRRNAMKSPVGWQDSAPQYARLYNEISARK